VAQCRRFGLGRRPVRRDHRRELAGPVQPEGPALQVALAVRADRDDTDDGQRDCLSTGSPSTQPRPARAAGGLGNGPRLARPPANGDRPASLATTGRGRWCYRTRTQGPPTRSPRVVSPAHEHAQPLKQVDQLSSAAIAAPGHERRGLACRRNPQLSTASTGDPAGPVELGPAGPPSSAVPDCSCKKAMFCSDDSVGGRTSASAQ
jgi:hypothetical protein